MAFSRKHKIPFSVANTGDYRPACKPIIRFKLMKTTTSDKKHWKDQILKPYMASVLDCTEPHLLGASFNGIRGSHMRRFIRYSQNQAPHVFTLHSVFLLLSKHF